MNSARAIASWIEWPRKRFRQWRYNVLKQKALRRLEDEKSKAAAFPESRAAAVLSGRSKPFSDAEVEVLIATYNKYSTTRAEKVAAVEELIAAAVLGNAVAQYQLSRIYGYDYKYIVLPDPTERMRWLRAAAEAGHPDAQYFLGSDYRMGRGLEKDFAKAIPWLRRAADQGKAAACTELGYSFGLGQGVEQDRDEALKWFIRAAELGEAGEKYDLARMLEFGHRVDKDPELAFRWYTRAAMDKFAKAERRVGEYFLRGDLVAKDGAAGLAWHRRAARHNDHEAQRDLAWWYFNSNLVPEANAWAYFWLRCASVGGMPEFHWQVVDELKEIESKLTPAELKRGEQLLKRWRKTVRTPRPSKS